ncbi:hypothetical protein BBJ28_00000469 [Nothophytophthora sp. Chile5]|nr:hypothetical protein BBJ28_00000469 [Nothophytophthora sp. Chile5]
MNVAKHAALWDEVQGSCEPEKLQAALSSGVDASALLDGWTPLHFLCENRSIEPAARAEGLRLLLQAGFAANAVDEDNKKTPLHLLCENDAVSEDALEALLAARPDTDAVDEDGNTALHYLGENSFVTERMVSVLLASKTKLNTQNQFQSTPAHYICQNSRLGKIASDYIPSRKQDCLAYLQKFTAPNLVPTGGTSLETAGLGGEDPSELPEPLKKALTAWNASLPPFDAAFYNAVSCEGAFEATYEEVQEVSGLACEAPSDGTAFAAWEKSLAKWRACILLAYAALVPPNTWHQYAEQYHRPVPSDLTKALAKVEAAWSQYPEQTQRRGRFEMLAGVFNS